MKKYVIGGLLLIAAFFGGWYYASPLMALSGLRDAAEAGDASQLEQHVDFPAVRESLKSEIKARMTEELGKPGADPMAALGLAFADQLVDKMLDNILTPQGIARLIERGKKEQEKLGKSGSESTGSGEAKGLDDFKMERVGLSEFRLTDPKNPNSPALIFKRDGLSWKLSAIDMSKVEFPGPAAK